MDEKHTDFNTKLIKNMNGIIEKHRGFYILEEESKVDMNSNCSPCSKNNVSQTGCECVVKFPTSGASPSQNPTFIYLGNMYQGIAKFSGDLCFCSEFPFTSFFFTFKFPTGTTLNANTSSSFTPLSSTCTSTTATVLGQLQYYYQKPEGPVSSTYTQNYAISVAQQLDGSWDVNLSICSSSCFSSNQCGTACSGFYNSPPMNFKSSDVSIQCLQQ